MRLPQSTAKESGWLGLLVKVVGERSTSGDRWKDKSSLGQGATAYYVQMDPLQYGRYTLSSKVFKYWVVDELKRQIKIVFQNGQELTGELALDRSGLETQTVLNIFDWERWWVLSETSRGNWIIAEAYDPYTPDQQQGRPSVYLDQNHWSTLARFIENPQSIRRSSERDAAEELIFLAQDGGVVLPLSSGNVRETSNLYGDQRYSLGVSIASLSGGWQLRHPLNVWKAEFIRALAEVESLEVPQSAFPSVVTLEPYAILRENSPAQGMTPGDPQLLILALASPGVILELLIHPEKATSIDAENWIVSNAEFAKKLAESSLSKHEKQKIAYRRALLENEPLLAAAAAELHFGKKDISQISDRTISRLFDQMPALGVFTRLMVMRQINSLHKWRTNDLTDLIFLCTAAGYADYVVAEKHTGTQLRQLQQSNGTKANICLTLEALVETIRADGVKTDSERIQSKFVEE